MQKRLFRIFLLMSMAPVAVALLLQWPLTDRYIDVLDSEGLNASLESSLELARGIVAAELDVLRADLGGAAPSAPSARQRLDDGSFAELPAGIADSLSTRLPPDGDYEGRVSLSREDWLVVARETESGRRLLAKRLDPELADGIRTVTTGGSRLRQIRLYYRNLQRLTTLALLLGLGLSLMVVASLLSGRMSRQISRPLLSLAEGTRKVAAGDLGHRVDVDAPDELGELVGAFNRMTGELERSKEELVRAERIAAWQGVARRLAHEIKNPLTPITLAMHRIEKRSRDPETSDAVRTVLEEAGNLKRLADEFSLYARLPEPEPETIRLRTLVRDVVDLYVDPDRIEVVWREGGDEGVVVADPGMIRQLAANLVKNAVAAMGRGGHLFLGLERDDAETRLIVEDDGPGLPEPVEQVFAPYFTTRASGTGLGLASSRKTAVDHGGRLDAENREQGGARFILGLPRRDA